MSSSSSSFLEMSESSESALIESLETQKLIICMMKLNNLMIQ